jgi:cytochrome c peroxidase
MSRASIDRLMRRIRSSATFAVVAAAAASVVATTLVSAAEAHARSTAARWSDDEREMLRSLSLSSLEPLRPDPTNRYGDDPRAAALGQRLFFDKRLSGNGAVSCGSCHNPDRTFQDDVPLARGMGTTTRRTMPIAGTAHGAWFFWDGRTDSQWSQALGPLESAVEHGGSRLQYAHVVANAYRDDYESIFGRLPALVGLPERGGPVVDTALRRAWMRVAPERREDISRIYANIGKAIAAYERRIMPAASRFDRYVDAELAGRSHDASSAFSRDEEAGLRLFIGKAGCTNCHNGALLSDDHFHNTGVPASRLVAGVDSGRATGVRQVLSGEFNCTSKYSDAKPESCSELRFAVAEGEELVRAFKAPSLRDVADRAPYMHAGQLATLSDVVAHYDAAPAAPAGHSEIKPLRLSAAQRRQLEAFLRTLSGGASAPPSITKH